MRVAVLVISAGLLVGANSREDAIKKDMDGLDGVWAMVSGARDGQVLPEDFVKRARRIGKPGETIITLNGDLYMHSKFTIDPTKKPKTIDYDVIAGPNKGMSQVGIYELVGDTVFCTPRVGYGVGGADVNGPYGAPFLYATVDGGRSCAYASSRWRRTAAAV